MRPPSEMDGNPISRLNSADEALCVHAVSNSLRRLLERNGSCSERISMSDLSVKLTGCVGFLHSPGGVSAGAYSSSAGSEKTGTKAYQNMSICSPQYYP